MSNHLPTEKKVTVVSALCEGVSIRGIERMTGINRNTIMNLGVRVGQASAHIMDAKLRGLKCAQIEVDEIWGFIGAKRNFVKTHGAIRMTPAMAAGVEKSFWTVAELVERCGE